MSKELLFSYLFIFKHCNDIGKRFYIPQCCLLTGTHTFLLSSQLQNVLSKTKAYNSTSQLSSLFSNLLPDTQSPMKNPSNPSPPWQQRGDGIHYSFQCFLLAKVYSLGSNSEQRIGLQGFNSHGRRNMFIIGSTDFTDRFLKL